MGVRAETESNIFFSLMQLITLPVRGKGVDAMSIQRNGAAKKTGLQTWHLRLQHLLLLNLLRTETRHILSVTGIL